MQAQADAASLFFWLLAYGVLFSLFYSFSSPFHIRVERFYHEGRSQHLNRFLVSWLLMASLYHLPDVYDATILRAMRKTVEILENNENIMGGANSSAATAARSLQSYVLEVHDAFQLLSDEGKPLITVFATTGVAAIVVLGVFLTSYHAIKQ